MHAVSKIAGGEGAHRQANSCSGTARLSSRYPFNGRVVAETLIRLDRVGADAGFAAGEGVAGAVEDLVVLVVLLAEGAEVVFAGPAVDGEVGAGDVGVAEEFGAQVAGRGAEELAQEPSGP